MAANDPDMSREDIRAALLAKIEAAWPCYKKSQELVRLVNLASNDQLRNHLALAELINDETQRDPKPLMELSPRHSEESRDLFARTLSMRWNPSGEYTLARDECGDWYSGPDWVPFNLLSAAVYEGGSPEEQRCAHTLMTAPRAEQLWSAIALKYARHHVEGSGRDARRNNHVDSIAASLPAACAEAKARWRAIPRLTPSEHKKQRDELARRAQQLAQELERFYLPRDPDDYEFPGILDFMALLTHEERDRFDVAVRRVGLLITNRARNEVGAAGMDWAAYNDIGDEARSLGYQAHDLHPPARQDAYEIYDLMLPDHTRPDLPYGGVPTLPDLLRRIAAKFQEDANDPPIKNPNLGNAERNFFARFLCRYFWKSYGNVSPSIVRDIVSMFYKQSITENDVSQMIARIKAAHPLADS